MAIHTNPASFIVESLSSPHQTAQTKRLHALVAHGPRATPDSPARGVFRAPGLTGNSQYHPFGRRGTSSTKFDRADFFFPDRRPTAFDSI
jgi:hypothetical protein